MVDSSSSALTVLVMCFKQQQWIREALAGVAAQRDVRIDEILLSDDASADDTVAAARRAADDLGISLRVRVNRENLGVSRHYGSVLPDLRTDLVAVLEGDDVWLDPRKLARQTEVLARHPAVGGVGTDVVERHQDGSLSPPLGRGDGSVTTHGPDDLIRHGFRTFSTMMYRTELLQRIDLRFFDLDITNWWVDAFVSSLAPLARLHLPTTAYRVSPLGAWSALTDAERRRHDLTLIDRTLPWLDPPLAQHWTDHRDRLVAGPYLRHTPARVRRSQRAARLIASAVRATGAQRVGVRSGAREAAPRIRADG
jgi:glycosyltransferase involved in cell wall biosynthesis